jgi:hypothetical protein
VTVTGTINAALTLTIADSTAAFGTNLDPSGTDSNSADGVTDVQAVNGSYYIWKTGGMNITVSSSLVWNGTVSATENSGTSTTLTVASGALRWTDGGAPGSYAACALATPFTLLAGVWKTAVLPGTNTYTTYYCLRDDFVDTPGTFASTVTYSAT